MACRYIKTRGGLFMFQYFIILLLLLKVVHTKSIESIDEYNEWTQIEQPQDGQDDDVNIPEFPQPEDGEERKPLNLTVLKKNMTDLSGLLSGIKPYMPKDVHKPIDGFCCMARFVEDIDNFANIGKSDDFISEPSTPSMTLYERQRAILEEFKKHVDDNGKEILDNISKVHEAIKQMKDIFQPSAVEAADYKDKIWCAIEAVKPLMAEDKQNQINDLLKKLKLFEAINSIDTITDDSQSKGQQMQSVINVIKPLMDEEQQESLDKFMMLAEMMSRSQGFNLDDDNQDDSDSMEMAQEGQA
ncbi:MAG: hypothetical protein PWP48_1056 [Clostridiales bacterium]|nr:hypothetical protein [Clostridiales bacterium]